jgi:hypothetical protein
MCTLAGIDNNRAVPWNEKKKKGIKKKKNFFCVVKEKVHQSHRIEVALGIAASCGVVPFIRFARINETTESLNRTVVK